MATSYIIALTVTLFVVCKDYIIKTRIYDYSLYFIMGMAWLCTFYPSKMLYVMSFLIFLLLCYVSNLFWGEKSSTDTVFGKTVEMDGSDENYMPMFRDKVGKVTSVFPNGSYLGSIVNNGGIDEILVYSNETLEKGDRFKILGIFSGKIYAEKI